jgi:hypothetical protein
MEKTAPSAKKKKVKELEPFNKRKVDFTKFKPDPAPKKLEGLFTLPGDAALFPIFFLTIETLSVTKTVGSGRTNLTFIMPTIVQTDAVTPYAGFDRALTPSRNPGIQMHFQPSAYGITSVSSYVMNFVIESFGQTSFNLSGYAGPGTLSNAGPKVLSGKTTVSLGFLNVPPSQIIYGYLEQTSGAAWNFYSVRARFPYPVFHP